MATSIELVREAKMLTGLTIVLRPFEQAVKVVAREDGSVAMKVQTYRVKETRGATTFTHRGVKLVEYRPNGSGKYEVSDELTMWEDDYAPEVIVNVALTWSPSDEAERKEHEEMCYRPGTRFDPMDNAERTRAGMTTTSMSRHW